MKVYQHLKLKKKNLAIPQEMPSIQSLGTFVLLLLVSSCPAGAAPVQHTTNHKTFADWCLNKANLSRETKYTVDVLLELAGTTDCQQADKVLSTRTSVSVNDDQDRIADLKPLSNLTNLTRLSLKDNSIANIKPLSTLTKLELLSLNNNSSLTDKTCPVKPESICIFLPLQSD